ncbi:MAG: Plug domain-containing protein, partial [Gammaproteobacteria bacterium]|nr:Plug domain-containing protein [Gammaproteobacteria bacterium]
MKKSLIYCSVFYCLTTLSNQAIASEETEVITVKGTRTALYDSRDVNVAAFGIKDPLTLPLSIQSFSQELMDTQRARTLIGVLNNDAAVQNSSVGNIFDFVSLRGFQLDWTNGLRRDGLALAPFQEPALENIQR